MGHPIPESERTQLLNETARELVEQISNLRKTVLLNESTYGVGITGIIYLWTLAEEFENEQTKTARAMYVKYGVDGDYLLKKLDAILSDDNHLMKCCGNVFNLAKLLQLLFDNIFSLTNGEEPSDAEFEEAFNYFVRQVYSEPFAFVTYSHVFNLELFTDELDFGDCQIQKLNPEQIPLLFDENTYSSLLHFPDAGHFFIVKETNDSVTNDYEHLINAHLSAGDLVRIFKYFKDGIVDLGYTTNVFRPPWLNGIRKNGSFHLGEARKVGYANGEKRYEISESDYSDLALWLMLFNRPEVSGLFGDDRNGLGKAIEFAGYYFESSHGQNADDKRLIDLAIALESVFSPEGKDEISFQLSQNCAEFIEETPSAKLETFKFIKRMYGKRSNLLHGNQKEYEKSPATTDDLDKFSTLIRRSLLKLIVLYINGAEERREIIVRIREGLFDPAIREKLQTEASIDNLIEKLHAGNDLQA